MESNFEIFNNTILNFKIENATVKECIFANIFQIYTYNYKEIIYKEELNSIIQKPYEEHENFMEGDNIVKIIFSYKNILENRGKYYLTNTWGINVDELANDIKNFEQSFKDFFNNLDINVKKEFDAFKESLNPIDSFSYDENEEEDYSIKVLYAYYKLIGLLDNNIAFTNLYISHIKKHEELKHKIYNAATKNNNEYKAELRISVVENSRHKHLSLEDSLLIIMFLKQLYTKFRNKDYDKKIKDLKGAYKKIISGEKDYLWDFLNIIPTIEFDPLNENVALELDKYRDFYSFVNFYLSNNIKYMYMLFHAILWENEYLNKKSHLKCGVGRLLYDGYIKWCKKNGIVPLIELPQSQLIEYPSSANDIPKEHYHFPKKRFINNSINEKREKLNKYFLEVLHKGMIEGEIIAKDTTLENFLFVFGYGGDIIANFKPIQVVKPDTSYKRENGKRTIRYLLEELMKYSDDEIRPLINGKKHLILNSCFSITDHQFKSSDFENDQIYKGNEISKIRNIYDTALNKAKEQNV